jgi:hypothetical protein
MKKRRALILYATMTTNTEKIATWFRETFEAYNWDVTFFRIKPGADYAGEQEKLYFDDYDVIALGSPIVAGFPIQPVIKAFSLGAGGELEKKVQKNIDNGTASGASEAPAQPGAKWRRGEAAYPGALARGESEPLGIVFCTYGGGFYGSSECFATLETLKLYLNLNNVRVVGKFACGGKETGPAGYALGEKPKCSFAPGKKAADLPDADVCDPVVYTMKDGTEKFGSYFFHYDLNSKPGKREEAKARAFAADFIEDFFMTYDGERSPVFSEIISIS